MSKRTALLEAAYKVFSQKGYHAASIKDIANEAGITPGLTHYYFKNKEEILFYIQNNMQDTYHAKYSGDRPSMSSAFQEIKERVDIDPDWYRWRYEIFSLGIKSETIQSEASDVLERGRQSLEESIEAIGGNHKDNRALASVLLAAFDGLALQKLMDDDLDLNDSYKLLEKLCEHYINNRD
ncbi:TetR/AcrR family transcriptional regulator [Aliicoccus persicus]|uniref:Transcriptional regulator, TetR family n=1 Tax=Aliicoccus persicus TaxID=930138 RepID=A0A662Z6S8_9STAP|nr:TetR/AcrR family transcriptional regulator [Aliicoccus persicus]SEW14398.1 transcriptional regulator, TetR family [Aliicoccus persicus]